MPHHPWTVSVGAFLILEFKSVCDAGNGIFLGLDFKLDLLPFGMLNFLQNVENKVDGSIVVIGYIYS